MNKAVIVSLCASLWSCGGSNNTSHPKPPALTGDLAFPILDTDGGPDTVDPGANDLLVSDDCPDNAKFVYVVDENNMFSSFKPDTLKFVDIGVLNCPAMMGATPFSMAVDRNAVAWVLYSSGEVFNVDTMNAKCTATKFVPMQSGFDVFGMGFSLDAVGAQTETLFVSAASFGLAMNQFGRIDTKTLKVTAIGNLNGSPELTGTGDARLWGFFPDVTAPHVALLDKKSGGESKVYKLNQIAGQPMAWAFAFWGGDFWIFLQRDVDSSTKVHRLKQSGTLTTPIPDSQRKIVGAGVSTCAPLVIQ